MSVLALWEGRPDVPVTQSLVRLLADEAVPFLAAYRYKDSGLRKREAWEETWALQRREDAGEKVGPIAVPPKYTSADFRKNSYWQARGKLDVPKERFILYPDAGRETDPTPLLGWAGWDHAQQSLALSLIIGEREKDGWADDRLVPLVAGLAELQPWVEQWHGEVDPDYGVSLAAFCREQLTARAAQVGKTLDELAAWRPAPATRGRGSVQERYIVTATSALTTDLQRQVLLLEEDLRARVAADAELEGRWKQEHQRALDKERTAASWVAWRDDRVTQAAVAWVLTTVFIRFCEDNALVGRCGSPGPESRRQEALDAQLAFFRAHPEDTDREWLQAAIDYLAGLPATKALVDSHSALHLVVAVRRRGDQAAGLLARRGEDGALVHDLTDPSLSTRFLGDLYQDLSEHAKNTYALLQTPEFVEEFILDRTLEPALDERPLEGFKLIDPTCGSGHFLLGAFDRLLDRWHRHAPGLETQARVQAALDAIHGVDLNPFAVAIARFRLTVAALQASGLTSLEDAPAFTFHLAVGDSLLHGPDPDVLARHERPQRLHALHLRHRGRPAPPDHAGGRPLRRRRRQPALHHGQGQGPQPDLPLQVRQRLQRQVRADRAVHGAVLRPRQAVASAPAGSGRSPATRS